MSWARVDLSVAPQLPTHGGDPVFLAGPAHAHRGRTRRHTGQTYDRRDETAMLAGRCRLFELLAEWVAAVLDRRCQASANILAALPQQTARSQSSPRSRRTRPATCSA